MGFPTDAAQVLPVEQLFFPLVGPSILCSSHLSSPELLDGISAAAATGATWDMPAGSVLTDALLKP